MGAAQPGVANASDIVETGTVQPIIDELGADIEPGVENASDMVDAGTLQPIIDELGADIEPGVENASDMVDAGTLQPIIDELGADIEPGVANAFDIVGASTIQPIIDELRADIEPQVVKPLEVRGGGSGAGIRSAREGAAVGMVSRALSAEEKRDLKYVTIGFDALAIIVNQDNPVSALSKGQVNDLFSGRISNWSEVGGNARAVVRVSKEVGRSTLDLFEGYSEMVSPDRNVADGRQLISKQSYVIGSNLQALTLVGGMPGAIGYVSLGSAQGMIAAGLPVKVLALDGVAPNAQTIVQGSYPIVRELNMVFRYETSEISALNAVLLSTRGQNVVESQGFLRAASR